MPKYLGEADRAFEAELRSRVRDYFNTRSTKANAHMIVKCAFWLSLHVGLYLLVVFGELGYPLRLVCFSLLGITAIAVAINIGHDASHHALSKRAWVNRLLAYAFDLTGASSYMWHITHDLSHHGYTNLAHADDGLQSSYPFLRRTPQFPRRAIHRLQHLYALPVYSLYTLAWVLYKDFDWYSKPRIGSVKGRPHPHRTYVGLACAKLLYLAALLVAPLLLIDEPWHRTFAGFVLMHVTSGVFVALVFQPNHATAGLVTPELDADLNVRNSWTRHVLTTTSDTSPSSWVLNWLYGGLNTHAIHHLYPGVCNIHYPALSAILRETAEKHRVGYIVYDGLFAAFAGHLHFLRALGRADGGRLRSNP
jgi:linoleoyl-CoA desaturase